MISHSHLNILKTMMVSIACRKSIYCWVFSFRLDDLEVSHSFTSSLRKMPRSPRMPWTIRRSTAGGFVLTFLSPSGLTPRPRGSTWEDLPSKCQIQTKVNDIMTYWILFLQSKWTRGRGISWRWRRWWPLWRRRRRLRWWRRRLWPSFSVSLLQSQSFSPRLPIPFSILFTPWV